MGRASVTPQTKNTTGIFFDHYSEPRFQTVGTPNISGGQSYSAAGTVGDYGLFPRGEAGVMCFDSQFVETIAIALISAVHVYRFAAATVGNYCLFAGGSQNGNSSVVYKNVYAYDTNLVKTSAQSLVSARCDFTGVGAYNQALFAGDGSAIVDAYDMNLVRTTPTPLSAPRAALGATIAGDYYLFGGGTYRNTTTDAVDAYSTALVRTTPTVLSKARYDLKGTSIGNFGLFAGGKNGGDHSFSDVDAYDAQLTRSTPTGLYGARIDVGAAQMPGYAVFACGNDTNAPGIYVSAYDSQLTRAGTAYGTGIGYMVTGTQVGDCAAFAAANNNTLLLTGIRSVVPVTVPPWWVYQFTGDTEETCSGNNQMPLTFTGPFSGYMKPADVTLSSEH